MINDVPKFQHNLVNAAKYGETHDTRRILSQWNGFVIKSPSKHHGRNQIIAIHGR